MKLPEFVADIPLLGSWLQNLIDEFARDPTAIRGQVAGWVEARAAESLNVVGGVGRNAAKLAFALITVFFLYRDGEQVLAQAQLVLHRFLGARVDPYLSAVGTMTTAVVWGLLLTALAQGLVAGVGYWWFGLEAPVMFGVLGGLAAFGLVGLFIGPVILAVLMAVWREWIEESKADQARLARSARLVADQQPHDHRAVSREG